MIEKTLFGKTANGEQVFKYKITSQKASASVITFGATLQSFIVPSTSGEKDIVLGYDKLSDYETLGNYLGATVGRNSNRIKNGEFTLNGEKFTLNKNNGKKTERRKRLSVCGFSLILCKRKVAFADTTAVRRTPRILLANSPARAELRNSRRKE